MKVYFETLEDKFWILVHVGMWLPTSVIHSLHLCTWYMTARNTRSTLIMETCVDNVARIPFKEVQNYTSYNKKVDNLPAFSPLTV